MRFPSAASAFEDLSSFPPPLPPHPTSPPPPPLPLRLLLLRESSKADGGTRKASCPAAFLRGSATQHLFPPRSAPRRARSSGRRPLEARRIPDSQPALSASLGACLPIDRFALKFFFSPPGGPANQFFFPVIPVAHHRADSRCRAAGRRARRRRAAGHRVTLAHGRGDRSDQGDRCPSSALRRRVGTVVRISDMPTPSARERNNHRSAPERAEKLATSLAHATDSCHPRLLAHRIRSHGARRARFRVAEVLSREALPAGVAWLNAIAGRRSRTCGSARPAGIGARSGGPISVRERSCGRGSWSREDANRRGRFRA